MSRWKNEFESHPIHETLRHASAWLDVEVEDTDLEFEEERRRLRKILETLASVISGLDGDFVPQKLIDQLQQHLQQPPFFQQLQAYAASPQTSYLQAANNHISQYAPQVYQLAGLSRSLESARVIKKAEEAFVSFSTSMEASANESHSRLDEVMTSLQKVDERQSALQKAIDDLEVTTQQRIAEWQSAFTEIQTENAKEHSDAQIGREKQFGDFLIETKQKSEAQRSELAEEQERRLQEIINRLTEDGEAIIEDMRQKHISVLEIHKLVGRDSVAGGYQKSAGEEKAEADRWRWISLGCLTLAVFWLGIKYFFGFQQSADAGMNWPEIITASSLTAIFLLAAGYTSRQSKIHRDNEKQLRSYALETKALDPFIASLEISEQQAIKAELVRRMFGQQNSTTTGKSSSSTDATVQSALERLPDAIAQSLKKVLGKG
ncbi:hypothetical protein M3N55_07530 [Roseibaca sp. V10]|uniref:ATPase involved in DNA repair n=1 Tax=Roseinatronobacter domitianus TaxID=2940293 RepID=A0ABT0M144_9RHOB|nr:hypothetical protein [Roseibaca domitiana]MCL1628578.1 hypothetical protein [Roseibaca domitiana]